MDTSKTFEKQPPGSSSNGRTPSGSWRGSWRGSSDLLSFVPSGLTLTQAVEVAVGQFVAAAVEVLADE